MKCVPWDMFALEEQSDYRICDGFETEKFRQITSELHECDCPEDCQFVSFSYETDTQQILPSRECRNQAFLKASYSAVNLATDNYAYIVGKAQSSIKFSTSPVDRCQEKMKNDFAIVQFIIDKQIVVKSEKQQSTNILQKFSVIGKYT